jgi:hypothetical protein
MGVAEVGGPGGGGGSPSASAPTAAQGASDDPREGHGREAGQEEKGSFGARTEVGGGGGGPPDVERSEKDRRQHHDAHDRVRERAVEPFAAHETDVVDHQQEEDRHEGQEHAVQRLGQDDRRDRPHVGETESRSGEENEEPHEPEAPRSLPPAAVVGVGFPVSSRQKAPSGHRGRERRGDRRGQAGGEEAVGEERLRPSSHARLQRPADGVEGEGRVDSSAHDEHGHGDHAPEDDGHAQPEAQIAERLTPRDAGAEE